MLNRPRYPEDHLVEAVGEPLRAAAEDVRSGAQEVWLGWPSGDRPVWAVAVRLREEPDRFDCVGFEVVPLRAGVAVSGELLRDLPVARLVQRAVSTVIEARIAIQERLLGTPPDTLTQWRPDSGWVTSEPDLAWLRHRQESIERTRRNLEAELSKATGTGRGRRYPPGHLNLVAQIVRHARKERRPVVAAVADAFGISKSAAGNQISRAKRAGLLDEPSTEEEQ